MTIAIGDEYRKIAQITHPTLRAYANRIGADFIDIDTRSISQTTPHFEKFQIYHLLNKYHRIIFIDTDIIVRHDCPNLFDIVPEDKLGAFNEGAFIDRSEPMLMMSKQYQIDMSEWDGKYYNTGVLVISRKHKFLFKRPAQEIVNFYEQTYLNVLFLKSKVDIYPLQYKYNRMTILDSKTGEHRRASYLIHYAGCPNYEQMRQIIKMDLKAWSNNEIHYKKNIDIQVHGGLGDEACAEPVIRYMIEHSYKDDDIMITTWYPRLFLHLPVPVYPMHKTPYKNDQPYYRVDTMAKHGCPSWRFMSPNLMHTTDYSSVMCLRGIIPDKDKQIRLKILPEDEQELSSVAGIDHRKVVLVHPGRGWPSKTFPKEYWDKVIHGLNKHLQVVIIGKHISDEQGTVQVDIPDGVIDLRNLLSLGAMMALIDKAPILISNDSAPVHIAGAFDNHIILIPTCKHPDHVLPYRKGRRDYKAIALHDKLTRDAYDHTPTQVHGQNIDRVKGDILEYLPDPERVISEARSRMPI